VYVLIKDTKPVYVGCAVVVSKRLKEHKGAGKIFDSHYVIYRSNKKSESLLVERTLIKFLTLFYDGCLNKQDFFAAMYRETDLLEGLSHG
jgi:hypothetical protein